MQATSNNGRRHAGVAVVRSYQPTRIERELLAQVFELASHGVTSQNDAAGGAQRSHDQGGHGTAQREFAMSVAIDCGDAQDCELERAA